MTLEEDVRRFCLNLKTKSDEARGLGRLNNNEGMRAEGVLLLMLHEDLKSILELHGIKGE